ncbi:MAG: NUDIX domain-containing protein [Verrucomicrobia bacterium]|nr:NUDIX domain-containing protein [Verrucomicrobiota bacterium]
MVRFRPNVAALIVKPAGQLLVCERWMVAGAWQFPQGGVDSGETPEQALRREIREEVGLLPHHYAIVDRRDGYRYLYPTEIRRRKLLKHGNHGQEQTYFLCRTLSDSPPVDVNQKCREFSNYRWIEPDEFDLDWLPPFKREVYQQVMWDFFAVRV